MTIGATQATGTQPWFPAHQVRHVSDGASHFMTDDVIVGLPLFIDDVEPLVVNSLNLLASAFLEIGASGTVSVVGNFTISGALLQLGKSASLSIGGYYNVPDGGSISTVELQEAELRMLNPFAPLALVHLARSCFGFGLIQCSRS